jgi:hypothetical protein
LFEDLYAKGIQLVTRVKKNMKNMLMPITDKVMLLKRAATNAFSHMLSCLINYQLQENKPSIKSLLPIGV